MKNLMVINIMLQRMLVCMVIYLHEIQKILIKDERNKLLLTIAHQNKQFQREKWLLLNMLNDVKENLLEHQVCNTQKDISRLL